MNKFAIKMNKEALFVGRAAMLQMDELARTSILRPLDLAELARYRFLEELVEQVSAYDRRFECVV